MSTIKAYLKDASLQTMAGGSAGFVEVSIMHPLDLVKTRLQIQTKANLNTRPSSQVYYNGVFDCFAKMYQVEGLKSLWKGVIPPILADTPKRAVKFVTFEQYKRFFMFGSDKPTPLTFSLAGFCAGVTEGIFVNPFEVVKVKMQADRRVGMEVPSTILVTKQIIRENGFGLNGLNKGLTATIARNSIFNMVYFGFYHSVKGYFKPLEDPLNEFFRKVFIGLLSGTMASCFNIPFDVAKSRIQGPQPTPGTIKYKTTLGSIRTVIKEEGFLALYKGLVPKIMRLGPGGAIMLLVYEYSYDYLKEKFA